MKQALTWLFFPFFLFAVTLAAPQKARAAEALTSFNSDITVQANQSLLVKEILVYKTTLTKHGIYRYIPVSYDRAGSEIRLKIHDVSVLDDSGAPIPVSQTNDGTNLTLKIGDPNFTFTGTKTYVISYVVDNALQRAQNGMRLYWDITGEGWQFPIQRSNATVSSPTATILNVFCYAGKFGSNDNACTANKIDNHTASFGYPKIINYGDNFTIDIQFDGTQGFIIPSAVSVRTQSLVAYVWALPLLLIPLAFFLIWYRFGRDYMYVRYDPNDQSLRPVELKPIFLRITPPFVYEPLDITPGQAGAMLDENYDIHDVVADILDLARRKYLTIEQTSKSTWHSNADYMFKKLKDSDDLLPEHEKLIMGALFSDSPAVSLSMLRGPFSSAFPAIKAAVFDELFSQTFYVRNPWKFKQLVGVGTISLSLAVFLILRLGVVMAVLLYEIAPLSVPLLLLDFVSAVFFVDKLTQKTGKGFNYTLLAKGLRETIKRGKWREEIMEKNLFIDEILPFAVALDVVDKLTKDMKDLQLSSPSYFGSSMVGMAGSQVLVTGFTNDLAKGLGYNSSSSAWGGGFSGGGFSGGGGGGGGGGSW